MSQQVRKKERYDIAVFTPQLSRDTRLFIDSFKQHLQKDHHLDCKTQVYLLSDAESLAARLNTQSHDLVVCLDDECTTRARAMVAEAPNNIPLIFSTISTPQIDTDHGKASQITGLSTPLREFAEQMILILSYTPDVKTILVIQDKRDVLMQKVSTNLISLLKKHEYTVQTMSAKPQLNRQETVEVGRHDMAILLSQASPEEYIQRLSVVCNEHKTVLYITDTTSVAYGAAFGFGKDDVSMGSRAATLAHHVVTTHTIPEISAVPYRLKINLRALDEQGLKLIKLAPLLSLVNTAHVVAPTTKEKINAYLRLEHIPLE